jgi:peptide/nickel transport system ATP-binding protein
MLFITHNLGLTRRFAHDVAVMQQGEIVEFGPAAQVFGSPRQDYTRSLIHSTPLMERGWLEARL